MDIRQTAFDAVVVKRQTLVIESKEVQDGDIVDRPPMEPAPLIGRDQSAEFRTVLTFSQPES